MPIKQRTQRFFGGSKEPKDKVPVDLSGTNQRLVFDSSRRSLHDQESNSPSNRSKKEIDGFSARYGGSKEDEDDYSESDHHNMSKVSKMLHKQRSTIKVGEMVDELQQERTRMLHAPTVQ